jgi:hypothetical protein
MAATQGSWAQAAKTHRNGTGSRHIAALAAAGMMALAAAYPAMAADDTWTGPGGVANSGGSWETSANWSLGTPATDSNAILGDVTAGDRIVTLDAPETINQLTMTQTTAGATNTLTLNDNLTISGNDNPLAITAATPSSVVLNIASGKTLLVTNSNSVVPSNQAMHLLFDGTLNLASSATATFQRLDSGNDLAPIRFGAINATGTGAAINLSATRFLGFIGGDTDPSHSFVTFGPTTVSAAGSLTFNAPGMNGTTPINNFNRDAHFNGDDGAGNAVNVATGGALNLNIAGTYFFDNRVNLGSNAVMTVGVGGTNSSTAATFTGSTLAAGSSLTVVGNNSAVTFAGTNSWASGSQATVVYTSNGSNGRAFITGNLTQDAAVLDFYWNSPGFNNGTRNWNNSGTWTLQNGASVIVDPASRSLSGFGQLAGNTNSGTMNILSGSSVVAQDVTNTGTLHLDSGTVGGVPANNIAFAINNNSGATLNVTGSGTSIIGGSVVNGPGNNNATLINGAVGTGSSVTVGTGLDTPTLVVQGANVQYTNTAGNTTTIAAGGVLKLNTLDNNGSGHPYHYATVALSNAGTMSLAGKLQLRPNHAGTNGQNNNTTTNTGTFIISGTGATIERLASNSGFYQITTPDQPGNNAIFLNQSGATLKGNSLNDVLNYVNSTGSTTAAGGQTFLTLTNSGTIDPGNGHDGSGLSSVGKLTLVNTSLTSTGGIFNIDLGGPGVLPLTYDNLTLSGDEANLTLGSGNTLNIIAVNGIVPSGTYDVLDALSRSGTFDTLLFNGLPANGAYTMNYRSNGADVVFTTVPEPASLGLLAFGALALPRRRRIA